MEIIRDQLYREECFQKTVENGLSRLTEILDLLSNGENKVLKKVWTSFDLYATHGLPLEITRDLALEADLPMWMYKVSRMRWSAQNIILSR